LDGFLVTSLENIRYFSGFTGSDAALILTEDRRHLLTDSRYTIQAQAEAQGYEIVEYRKKAEGIADTVLTRHLGRLGFESEHLNYALHANLSRELPQTRLVPLDEEIRTARIRKDASEIRSLRKTISIAEAALLNSLHLFKPGVVEKEVAREIEFEMRRLGADAVAFETIVASGERGALPHGKASDRKLKKGDFIIVDFGARHNGYHSDETCTLSLGSPTSEQKKVYSVVREAHDRAIATIRPGVSFEEIDHAARDYIRDKGHGNRFAHGLGHGVGLAVHEEPRISFDSSGVTETGMVFTIEPGIYIPDWGGVRIEDMVLVKPEGCEVLTHVDKELKVL
jgi:Xaa-Pro aminopeptidase